MADNTKHEDAPTAPTGSEGALITEDLVKEYPLPGLFKRGRNRVVDSIDLAVERGSVYGFLGKNGAGKTTTIKMILGLTFPTSGSIRILGVPHDDPYIKGRVGFAPEKPAFYSHLTGWEILIYVGQLAGLDRATIRSRGERLLELVSLQGDAHRLVKEYSKGMQQRLGLIQSLIHDPELIIFDEPATGLDPFGRRLVKDLILGMKAEGRTVFFSSHQLLDVQEVCDRVGIIHRGRLVREAPVQEIAGEGENLESRFVEMITQIDEREGQVSTID